MELIEKTLGQCLEDQARKQGDHLALEEKEVSCTYSQLNRITQGLGKDLEKLGIRKGTHVGIWSENSPAWVFLFLALVKLGAVPVLVNTCYKTEELRKVLDYSDVEVLYYGKGRKNRAYLEIITDLREKMPQIRHFISMDEMNNPAWIQARKENVNDGDETDEKQFRPEAGEMIRPEDTACMIFTSGTTSMPKGVMLSHYSIVNNARAMAEAMHWTENDKMCITVPLFHCFGVTAGIAACMVSGMSMYLIPYFKTCQVWDAIENCRCSILNGVPSMFLALIRKPEHAGRDGSVLKSGIIAGSPVTAAEYREICGRFPTMHLQPSYGQTETSPCISMAEWNASMEEKAASAGKILEHVDARIYMTDPVMFQNHVAVGEIQVRGYNLMQGYYKRPEANKNAFTEDGWLKTGDLGYLDASGNLHVTGRLKEMIIRAGENISPREIEEVLEQFEGTEAVKVVGVPAEVLQEEIAACVVPKPGRTIDVEQLKAFARSRLADYKVPAYVFAFREFPMTESGKVDLKQLRILAQRFTESARICVD